MTHYYENKHTHRNFSELPLASRGAFWVQGQTRDPRAHMLKGTFSREMNMARNYSTHPPIEVPESTETDIWQSQPQPVLEIREDEIPKCLV